MFAHLQGELIGICGMKGSGKSALLSAIMGRVSLYNSDMACVTHTHKHMHALMHACTPTRTHTHILVQLEHLHTCMLAHMHTLLHAHTCTHACTHAYTHTHTHVLAH